MLPLAAAALTLVIGLAVGNRAVVADEPASNANGDTAGEDVSKKDTADHPEAAPSDKPVPQWIWLEDAEPKQTVYAQTTFDVPGDITAADGGKAVLVVAADNNGSFAVNGKTVGRLDQWTTPVVTDVVKFLKPGETNTLTIRARNEDGPAGILASLELTGSWSGQRQVVSNADWRVSPELPKRKKAWRAATELAAVGQAPWDAVSPALLTKLSNLEGPKTTATDSMKTLEGFTVELVYDVPQASQGSWVNLCVAGDRLVASDQYGKLYWVTPGEPGRENETQVEPLDLEIGFAQGLLWAFDSLYVMTNSRDKFGSKLYRCRDTSGDGQLDEVETLIAFEGGGGEHGPHAIVLTPDEQGLYLVLGNQTELCEYTSSRVPEIWDEDILTPRVYGKGFMRSKMAPGGYVLRIDPTAEKRELVSVGYRNQYDAALNWRGDLFTYDADMEWDWNTPWYRPTRVCQVVSGSDYGWRNGSAKWPAAWPDSYPPVLEIGPGSPTGVTFGYDAKFPAKYQDALYICDWTYGKLYAIHLTEEGAGYSAKREEFVIGTPLPLTDVVCFPKDGAMYFALGGRRIKSGLYRVRYTGEESTEPVAHAQFIPPLHQLRAELEEQHASPDPEKLPLVMANIGHDDEQIRYAARVALEHIALTYGHEAEPDRIAQGVDAAAWNPNVAARLNLLIAISHIAEPLGLDLDATRATALEGLLDLNLGQLDDATRVDYLRTLQLVLIRLGEPTDDEKRQLVARLGGSLEGQPFQVQNDLYEVLVFAGDPAAASKGMTLLREAATQEQQIAIAKSLRLVPASSDWTPELHTELAEWFLKARRYRGGASFELFVNEIRDETLANFPEETAAAMKAIATAPLEGDTLAAEPREFVRQWTLDEAWPVVESGLTSRDFENGRKLFAAAQCAACHRYGTDGGAIGPDLTNLAGRFSARDLLEHTLDPNKEVSDQYAATTFLLADGRVINGRVTNLSGDTMRVNTNMLDPNSTVTIDRKMIDRQKLSDVSMMPSGLLNTLDENELLDLMAYLLSRGDAKGPMFE